MGGGVETTLAVRFAFVISGRARITGAGKILPVPAYGHPHVRCDRRGRPERCFASHRFGDLGQAGRSECRRVWVATGPGIAQSACTARGTPSFSPLSLSF